MSGLSIETASHSTIPEFTTSIISSFSSNDLSSWMDEIAGCGMPVILCAIAMTAELSSPPERVKIGSDDFFNRRATESSKRSI